MKCAESERDGETIKKKRREKKQKERKVPAKDR